jgi:hypothetical protein
MKLSVAWTSLLVPNWGYNVAETSNPRSGSNCNKFTHNYGDYPCLFYKFCFSVRQRILPTYTSTEDLSVYVRCIGVNFVFVILNRTVCAAANVQFLADLADIFEWTAIYSTSLVIIGDSTFISMTMSETCNVYSRHPFVVAKFFLSFAHSRHDHGEASERQQALLYLRGGTYRNTPLPVSLLIGHFTPQKQS